MGGEELQQTSLWGPLCSLQDAKTEKSTLKWEVRYGVSSVAKKKEALPREEMCNGFWRCLLLLSL